MDLAADGQRRIDLVVTDLDGTLWGADERVHERTLAALRVLERSDVGVLVATGRRLGSAVRTLASAGLTLPAVVLDGALGYDTTASEVFHRVAFGRAQAHRVLEAFERAGLSPCVYVDRPGAEVVTGARPSTHPEHLESLAPWIERDEPVAVVEREPVLMFAVIGGAPEAFAAAAAAIRPRDGSVAVTRDIRYGGATITVRPPGVSKWDGVLSWCRARSIDPGRVLAIGDGQNDVELLRGAAVACAVRDGCDEVLELAHHLVDPPSAGGWSAVVDLVGAGLSEDRARAGP